MIKNICHSNGIALTYTEYIAIPRDYLHERSSLRAIPT